MSGWSSGEKWPRVYAREIMELKSKEERKAMFEQVPQHLKDLVWTHCLLAVRGPHAKR
jgi:hypothetical protein